VMPHAVYSVAYYEHVHDSPSGAAPGVCFFALAWHLQASRPRPCSNHQSSKSFTRIKAGFLVTDAPSPAIMQLSLHHSLLHYHIAHQAAK
jgi:hypothetical protein